MRWLAELPLPPYSYVPGKYPHPHRIGGHRATVPPPEAGPLSPDRWRQVQAYLRGIDLFQHGYYWEAHEAWEEVWIRAGRRGITADFLKALIKLAAALVKAREGRAEGVRRHARRAAELAAATSESCRQPCWMGVDLQALHAFAEQLAERPEDFLDTSDAPAVKLVAASFWPSPVGDANA